jgi:hypothetical protein
MSKAFDGGKFDILRVICLIQEGGFTIATAFCKDKGISPGRRILGIQS